LRRRRFPLALMLGIPVALVAVAIILDLSPNFARTQLFVAAILLVAVGAGIDAVVELLRFQRFRAVAVLALVACVAVVPVADAIRHVEHPFVKEEIKPVLRELVKRWRPGDTLYVHYAAQYAFRYYAECH